MNKKNLRDGFSLLELMIVVALTAILVCLAAVNTRYLNKSVLRAEVDALCATCRYMQQVAIARNHPQTLTLDSVHNSYEFDGQVHYMAPSIHFGIVPGVKGPPSMPHVTLAKAITFKNNTIEFTPDGIINSGTMYITDSHELYAISSSVAHTSYLRTYRFDGSWRVL